MAKTDPGWELYRSFLAVMREGSLSGAARTLGLAQPTVGRHVQELESSLGTALFTRGQSGLRPTDAAHTLEPYAASEIIGAEVLPPILTDFRGRHPGTVVELSLSDRTEDLLRREADIAVRMIRPKQGSLVARRVGSVTVGLHAHRRYLHERGQPGNMAQLSQHALIGFDRETTSIRVLQRVGLKLRRDDFAFRTDSHLAQLAAIRAGFGIGLCQTAIARRDPDVIRVLPDNFGFNLEIWIAMHEDLRATLPIRTLFAHLTAGLSDYARTKGRRER